MSKIRGEDRERVTTAQAVAPAPLVTRPGQAFGLCGDLQRSLIHLFMAETSRDALSCMLVDIVNFGSRVANGKFGDAGKLVIWETRLP